MSCVRVRAHVRTCVPVHALAHACAPKHSALCLPDIWLLSPVLSPILQLIDSAATNDGSVSEADLHHILRNMDASCAQAIIEDILDEATLDQDSHVHKQESSLKVHAGKRARRASRLRRRLDRLSMHQSNLFESSKGPRLIKLESEPDARSVEVDSIPNRAFKEMLRRDENVASVVSFICRPLHLLIFVSAL